jgi:hypothetical protein
LHRPGLEGGESYDARRGEADGGSRPHQLHAGWQAESQDCVARVGLASIHHPQLVSPQRNQ